MERSIDYGMSYESTKAMLVEPTGGYSLLIASDG